MFRNESPRLSPLPACSAPGRLRSAARERLGGSQRAVTAPACPGEGRGSSLPSASTYPPCGHPMVTISCPTDRRHLGTSPRADARGAQPAQRLWADTGFGANPCVGLKLQLALVVKPPLHIPARCSLPAFSPAPKSRSAHGKTLGIGSPGVKERPVRVSACTAWHRAWLQYLPAGSLGRRRDTDGGWQGVTAPTQLPWRLPEHGKGQLRPHIHPQWMDAASLQHLLPRVLTSPPPLQKAAARW